MKRALALLVTFAVVLSVVLGGAALASTTTEDTREDLPTIENPQYTDDDLLPDTSPGQANVTMETDVEPQTIVIDPGIDPQQRRPDPRRFFFGRIGPETAAREIMPLANALVANGHNVRIYTPPEDEQRRPGPSRPGAEGEESLSSLGQELADADAFVTFRTDYSDDQLADLETFASEDGRVMVANEPDDAFEKPNGLGLKSALGVTFEPGYVYNLAENDMNYLRIFAEPDGGSPVTEGVDRAVFPDASPVGAANDTDAALVPTDGSELSTTRAKTDAPVLLQQDNVVVIGDTDFLIPENAQRADNDVLIGNLAEFLVTNDRTPAEQPPSEPAEEQTQEGPRGPTPPGGPGSGTERPTPSPSEPAA